MSLSLKRRYPFCQTKIESKDQESERTSKITFSTAFDKTKEMSGRSPVKQDQTRPITDVPAPTPSPSLSLQKPHYTVNKSGFTSISSSSNTSPTTTLSTIVSTTDERTTPDSSPDSPGSKMATFKSRSRIPNNLSIVPPSNTSDSGRPPPSPSKKPRNTKNLSLNVPPPGLSPSVAQFSSRHIDVGDDRLETLTSISISAPSSPAFIVPEQSNPKRRPSNLGLTIKLPNTLSLSDVPRSSINALRHHQSSPSLFSVGPHGTISSGMGVPQSASFKQTTFQLQRPHFINRCVCDGDSAQLSNSPPKSSEILHEMDEEDHEPRSGEAKSPAYPTGPALIFEPNIYLYAEPNAELASQFDVIINVAREVLNPFEVTPGKGTIAKINHVPITACTETSFKTAFEDATFSPIRTYAGMHSFESSGHKPEYVHMLWDHNTPILEDLPELVELISKRSDEGKKVLVHCQCGVSRSATLLIAYSMYKNPEKPMQDAYSAVKAKSRWIGPNMSLIYQLTDWKKMITAEPPKTAAFGGWGGVAGVKNLTRGVSTAGLGRGSGLDNESGSESIAEPQTAPLPDRGTVGFPADSPVFVPNQLSQAKPSMVRTRSEHGGFISSISPGPSSAPPGMMSLSGSSTTIDKRQSWPEGDAKFRQPLAAEPSPKLPKQSWTLSTIKMDTEPPPPTRMPPPPPRPIQSYTLEKPNTNQPSACNSALEEGLSKPNAAVTSPRNSGFWATVPSRRSGPWGFFTDPRSPTEGRAQTPIIRSIFDVL